MLGDHDTRSRSNQPGGGGDVEGSGKVAAGAAGVDAERLFGGREGKGEGAGAKGVDEAGELCGGLVAGGEGAEEGGGFEVAGGVRGRVEDGGEEGGGIGAGEGLALLEDEFEAGGDGVLWGGEHAVVRVAVLGCRSSWGPPDRDW